MDIPRYLHASRRATDALRARLRPHGSFGPEAEDLACHFKAPTAFLLAGHLPEAHRVLDHIKERHQNGFAGSRNPNYMEFRAYMPGWIAMAAQRMGRFGTAGTLRAYLRSFHHPSGGFTTRAPFGEGDDGYDLLTTAHLGLGGLYFGMPERALAAGEVVMGFLDGQPDDALLVRKDTYGYLVSDFPPEAAAFHRVSRTQPRQAFLMIGYASAFLAKLYGSLRHPSQLAAARRFLDFALQCEGIDQTHWSHKVGWGAAIVARLTGEPRYADLATRIADHLVATQDADGMWLATEGPLTSLDQTAESAIWLMEISAELSGVATPGLTSAALG